MVFIDNLAYSLFAISVAGFLLLYTFASMYLAYRKRSKDYSTYLKGGSIPLAIVGAYLVVMGLWGQFVWPLPGSYNILFYDPFVSFGLIMLAFAAAARTGGKMEYAGFMALLFGVMVIIYGIQGYGIGLTQEPIALLAMYFFYGVAAIFAFPVSLIADRMPGLKPGFWKGWYVMLGIFFVSLLIASLLAGYIGALAIPAHLLSAP